MKKLICPVILLALALLPAGLMASEFKPAATVLKMHTHVDIDIHGREVIDEHMVIRIERKDAVDTHANRRLDFSPRMHRIEILEAFTVDSEGRMHNVPRNTILTQENAIDASAPKFSDFRFKVIVFPKVEVGSVLHLRHRTTSFRQRLPGQITFRDVMDPRLVYEDVRYTVVYPEKLGLQVEGRGMNGGRVDAARGQVAYRYEYRQLLALESEPGAVSYADYAPFFSISSYRDWVDLGRDYQKHAAPRSAVTPEVQALADRITESIVGRRAQIDALYRWVAQNIRYVSVIIDRSGLIPNTTADILRRRYGDCKDHVTLLGALLRARGIDSSPALINLGASYVLTGPAAISPLNHVILYVPDEDLYLDSTASSARPGDLYIGIAGKPVILTALGRLARTPDLSPDRNRKETDIDLAVDKEGHIHGRSVERFKGDAETGLREWGISAQSSSMEKNVRSILAAHGEIGKGRYSMSDPYDLSRPFEVVSDYELDPVSNVPGPGGWRIPNGLMTSGIRGLVALVATGGRRTPFICQSETIIERYQIRFPETMAIRLLPPNVNHQSRSLVYRATYAWEGDTVRVERMAIKRYGKSVCGVDEWEEVKAFQAAIRRDLRGQFVY